MKKLSLIAALTLSTMLSACGGGGGHGGHIPSTTLPTIPDGPSNPSPSDDGSVNVIKNTNITEMNTRVLADSSALTDLVKGIEGLEDVYAGVEQPTAKKARARFAVTKTNDKNICKSENDCNRELFNNMVRILVENNLENAGVPEIKKALLLAGFTQKDLAGHIDDLKAAQEYIRTHQDEIKSNLNDFFNKYPTVTIDDAKLNLVTLHEDQQKSFVRLVIDEDNRISGVEISKNHDMANELNYLSSRNGDENEFKSKQKIYRYGINSTHYYGTFIDSLTELTPEEQSKRLKQRVDELAKTGAYDSEDAVANTKKAIDIALGLDKDDSFNIEVTNEERDVGENEPDKFIFYSLDYDKNETITYTSYAKDMKLAYSDFGKITKNATFSRPVVEGVENESFVFAGGYDSKKIEAKDLVENMEFAGRAIGAVNVVYGANGEGSDESLTPLDLDGNAKLTFDVETGLQTVSAKFNNWYDVTAESNINNKSDKLTLDNWKSGTADDYKFRGQSEYIVNDFTTAKQLAADYDTAIPSTGNEHEDTAFGALNIGYYGDNGVPNEATGYIFYEEGRAYNSEGLTKEEFEKKYEGKDINEYYDKIKNISVNIGFGTQRQ